MVVYLHLERKNNDNLIDIVNPKNKLKFSWEDVSQKENWTLQFIKVSGESPDIVDKKYMSLQ